MVTVVKLVWGAWGGLIPTSILCATVDALAALKWLPASGAAEILVVAVVLQYIRWRDADERGERGVGHGR